MARTVKVPEQFGELFDEAEALVTNYFKRKQESPEEGRIDIEGERYVLVRAPSLSVEFYDMMESLYSGHTEQAHAVVRNLLFHLSHFIGCSDARAFHRKLGLEEPVAKLSAGPVHFAHAGWASVEIQAESNVQANDDFFLVYDHPYSFEAESWREADRSSERPICFMNAGYSSGWCEESFGVNLVATEILCTGKGDPCCRFIMGHPSKIEEHVSKYLEAHPELQDMVTGFEVPGEFEQRDLERRLQLSESRYEQLFEAAKDAIVVLDRGRIEHVNGAAETLLGETRGKLVGQELSLFAVPIQRDGRRSRELLEAKVGKATNGDPQVFSYRFGQGDAEETLAEISLSKMLDSPGRLLAVIRDVTERERLALEVRQLQKMEALGTLAGGVAHNFNNLLTGVSGNLSLLRRELGGGGKSRERIDDAQRALDRAASIVKQLLTLTRTGQEPPRPVLIGALVEENVRLLRETIDRRIEIEVACDDADLRVLGDSNGLSQALVNLVVNARDAVSERLLDVGESLGGYQPTISIRSYLEKDPLRSVAPPGVDAQSEASVCLVVEDNGSGMTKAMLRRACEPFFTTKPPGKGTGLGLTTVFGIAQQHGGWFELKSVAGEGTAASLRLPVALDRRSRESSTPRGGEVPPGKETILFVDDERSLRKLATSFFSELGFTVLLAADGAEALSLLKERRGEIDIVVLDVVMPKLSGREVLRRIARDQSSLPVILSSGYSTDAHASELIALGAAAVMPKPYRLIQLAWKIRHVLDEWKSEME